MASSSYTLLGKVAIVTGSSGGLGSTIALEFVRLGACVTLHGRKLETLEKVCNELCKNMPTGGKKPLIIVGDICKEEIRLKLINDTVKHFGRLDILVNNAGHHEGKALLADFELKRLDSMLDIHTRVPFHLTKLALPHLLKTKGNIVNISSVAGMKTVPVDWVEYSIGKAAMDMLTKYTANEVGIKGVRCNSINPGGIKTGFYGDPKDEKTKALLQQTFEKFGGRHALNRMGEMHEVAAFVGFIASDKASFISGALLPVDGGSLVYYPKD